MGALIGQSPQRAVPLWRAAVIVAVFSLHNAWNCWVFLNFTNFGPPKKMFDATEADIGFITTMGWLGILSSVPIVTVCTWHRTLLWVAGVLNVLPPVVRYYAGVHGNYALVVGTNFAQGEPNIYIYIHYIIILHYIIIYHIMLYYISICRDPHIPQVPLSAS